MINLPTSWLTRTVLALLFASGHAAASFLPPGVTYWFFQRSLVVKNWLYIDGGEIWGTWGHTGADASAVWNEQTFAIDLSKSWTTDSVVAVASNKSSSAPVSRRPDVWYDPVDDIVRSVAGAQYARHGDSDYAGPPQEWVFKPQDDGSVNWSIYTGDSNGPAAHIQTCAGQYVTTPDAHFIYGGFYASINDGQISGQAISQMFTSNFTSGEYENKTLSNNRLTGAEGQYVPVFGTNGIILYFGGHVPIDIYMQTGNPAGLDIITVYDIESKKFYRQAATNAPPSRINFCSASAGTPGKNGTYEIFMYGGKFSRFDSEQHDDEALEKVYILTLPAFTWIEAPNKADALRTSHTCTRVNNRQMLSIGGVPSDGLGNKGELEADPLPDGLALFDMTTLEWTTEYDPDAAAYEPADMVTASYEETGTYPPLWSDPALERIFMREDAPQNPSETTTGAPTSTDGSVEPTGTDGSAEPTNTDQDAAKVKAKTPVGAIVGGVVGGVAVIAIIVALVLWRYRTQQPEVPPPHDPASKDSSSYLQAQQDSNEMCAMGQINEAPWSPIHELHTPNSMYEDNRYEIGPGR